MTDRLPNSPAAPGASRFEVALFVVYALWCGLAIIEIFGRKLVGGSPLPGILANHNGNIAVSGFIVPFGAVARLVEGRRDREGRGSWIGSGILVIASGGWTIYFVVLELFPVYDNNVMDPGDVPASLFGAFVGTYAAFRVLLRGRHDRRAQHRALAPRTPRRDSPPPTERPEA